MVSFPKDRINIYKCHDFRDPVIYTGTGSGRVAAAPAGSACINSQSFLLFPRGAEWAGADRGGGLGCAGRLLGREAHMEAEFSSHMKT